MYIHIYIYIYIYIWWNTFYPYVLYVLITPLSTFSVSAQRRREIAERSHYNPSEIHDVLHKTEAHRWWEHARTKLLSTWFMSACPNTICPTSPFPFHPLKGQTTLEASTYRQDGHHNHNEQVQRWLEFILHTHRKRIPDDALKKVWECLVKDPVFHSDQRTGLEWFTKVCTYYRMKASPC